MKKIPEYRCIYCGSSGVDIESYGPRKTCKCCHTSLYYDEYTHTSVMEFRLLGTRWFSVPEGTLLILADKEV